MDTLKGRYLTPRQAIQHEVYGAVYDATGKLIADSIRSSESALFTPRDPCYLNPQERSRNVEIEGPHAFLGHSFSQYGHFLLETLPMLSPLLTTTERKGIFLPWGKNDDLLFAALGLLGLSGQSAFVHRGGKLLKGIFYVYKRPLVPNSRILQREPYDQVLEKIKQGASRLVSPLSIERGARIFLDGNPSRIECSVSDNIYKQLSGLGFARMIPESHSLAEQVTIFANASIVVGFSGSRLHNSIFCGAEALVVEIGDKRSPNKGLKNQEICNYISGSESAFVQYNENIANITDVLHSLLH